MDRLNKLAVGLSLLGVAALGVPAGALAADSTVSGSVLGGSLSLTTSAIPSFSATLNGSNQTKTFTIPSVLSDTRGTGAGWNTTITSTQYTTGVGGKTLPTNASTVTSLAQACQATKTCTNPTNSVTLPVSVPAGSIAPTAVKYHNAAVDTGLGEFDHTPTISVAIPGNAFAGTYTSTITLAVVSGP